MKVTLSEDFMRAHSIGLAVLAAFAGLIATLGASAQETGKKKGSPQAAAHATVVQELFQTRLLLEKANHDYDGFRAKAVHQIAKAMHELHPHHKHPGPSIHTPKGPPNHEDQKLSDLQLAQAGK